MKTVFIALLALVGIGLWPCIAAAQNEIVHCSDPVVSTVTTDPGFKFCNIYDRQLAYKENRSDFYKQLKERQKNFAAPGLEAQNQYLKDVETMHEREVEEAAEIAEAEAEAEAKAAEEAEVLAEDAAE